jgi:hypothetical protein
LDGENEDLVAGLFEAVDDQHPSPGSEDEAHRVPASVELPADVGELLEDAQGALDAVLGIGWKAVGDDHAVEVFHRDCAQPDFGHGLQRVEWDRLAGLRPREPKLSAFVSAGDTVEHGDDATRVWVGFLDRHREQGAGKGALLDMGAVCQLRKSCRMLWVEGDVQAM